MKINAIPVTQTKVTELKSELESTKDATKRGIRKVQRLQKDIAKAEQVRRDEKSTSFADAYSSSLS